MSQPTTVGKLAVRAAWVALAAGLSWVVAQLAGDNNLIGPSTPLVYLVLRTVQDLLDPTVPNK